MSSNVVVSSTGVPIPNLPTVEEVEGWSAKKLNGFLKSRLNIDNHIDTITVSQEVDGSTFLDFTTTDFERWGIPGGPSKRIEKLISQIKGEQTAAGKKRKLELSQILQDFIPDEVNLVKKKSTITEFVDRDDGLNAAFEVFIKNHEGRMSNQSQDTYFGLCFGG
ncbi:1571_t:CDS:2, partial [Funneliformis caledonium]